MRLGDVSTIRTSDVRGLVVTVMMTQKPDPQRGAPIADDFLQYIRPWWRTVNRVGLQGVILHDGLPREFIDRATTPQVSFRQCSTGDLPILHQRHFAVRDFLKQCDEDFVLVTDVSDVAFKRDPFEIMAEGSPDIRLYFGSEVKTIAQNRCLRTETEQQYGDVLYGDRRVMNPGIVGGRRCEVLAFLEKLTAEIERLQPNLLASDMCIVNRVLHSNYAESEVFTGAPLHSRFRGWEYSTLSAVMHK
ncbi:MAG: hypothetical protein R3C49_24270 [Planctomycetaceae bacterium]